ncbi:hypothetical protein BH23GEM2_BH23GEM2_06320 [soil metagenome]
MDSLRRVFALASGLLVLQLTLLGAAAPCTDHGVGGIAGAGHEQSGGASVSTAPVADGHEDCDGSGPTESTGTETSGGSCIAMISCVTPMLQLDPGVPVDGANVINTLVAAAVLEPPTRTTAPELPPPRA